MKIPFLKHSILLMTSVVYITLSFAQKNSRVNRSSSTYSNSNNYLNVNENNSVNPTETLINYKNGAEKYTIKMTANKVTELSVDDKKIPADSFYLYNDIVNKIKEQIKKDKAQAEEDRKQADKDRAQAALDRQQAEKDRQHAERDREQAGKDRQQAEKDRVKFKEEQGQAELYMKQAEKDREQAEKDRQQALKDQAQAVEDRKQAELDRKQAEKDRKQAEEDRAIVKSLIEELVKEHIIPDEKSVTSLVLTDDEFTINGKKQPEKLHNTFKTKFLKKRGSGISYGYRSGYSIYINNEPLPGEPK